MEVDKKMPVLLNQEINSFLTTVFHSNDLETLLNRAAKILKNPVAVFDTSYSTLGYSDVSKIKDPEWLGGQQRGYCLYEYAALLHKSGADCRSSNSYTILDNFGSRRRRISPLILNSDIIGYLGILEYDTPFGDIPDEYYQLIQGALTKEIAIERAIQSNNRHISSDTILIDLINSTFANRSLFQQRILGTEFEHSRIYQLVCIDMKSFVSKSKQLNGFKEHLRDLFPSAWSVFIKRHVVLLIGSTDQKSSAPLTISNSTSLKMLLKEYQVQGAVSDPFSDLYTIRQYYDEAIRTLEIAIQLNRHESLLWYDAYKLLRAAASIPKDERPQYYTQLLQNLLTSDKDNGTEYIQTLFVYLETGKSLAATGNILSVHRNTISYRIERMKELFSADFSNEYVNLQNYFGCMLIMLSQ